MPRKGHIRKRTVSADPVFGIQTLTKFVNLRHVLRKEEHGRTDRLRGA